MAVRDVVQAAAGVGGAGDLAAAIDFDGTDDLSRSSDLVGSVDSKTFTFSAWVYTTSATTSTLLASYQTSNQRKLKIYVDGGYFRVEVWSVGALGADAIILSILGRSTAATKIVSNNTWQNFLFSVDLSNTSNCFLYVDDVVCFARQDVYTNALMDLTNPIWSVASLKSGTDFIEGRLSNVYFDTTYRDLSVTNNRRLFITEDGKPADGQAGLNPIMYMPLDDPEDIGYNAGTGGDFTVNGVMARSGRGPNQDNCVASKLDGSNDWLGGNGQSAFSSSRMTISFIVKWGTLSTWILSNGGEFTGTEMNLHIDGTIIKIRNSAGTIVFQYTLNLAAGSEHLISLSFDLTNASSKCLFIDGVDKTSGVTYNATGSIYYASNWLVVGRNNYTASQYFDGSIGELFIDNSYKDLVSNNIFYDDTLNKPKTLRQVLADEGINPLHAYPISANNPELNIGSNGSITAYGGGVAGARGASEHLSRSMNKLTWVNNSTLSASTKTFSFVFAVKPPDASARHAINWTNGRFDLCIPSTTTERFYYAAGGTSINIQHSLSMGSALRWYIYFVSVDMDDQSKTRWYVKPLDTQSTLAPSLTYSSFTTGEPVTFANFAVNMQSGYTSDYEMSSVYFTTSYIDFSQEAERLKFADAFGYPLDIAKQIEDGVVPTPTFYLPFDTPTNFGKNLGSGGDFTVNGANQYNGSDVSPT